LFLPYWQSESWDSAACQGGSTTNGDSTAAGSDASSTPVATGPELTLWCTALDDAFTKQMITDFKAANPDYANYNIHVIANVAENETQGKLHKDTASAADVICMVDDNIRAAVNAKDLLAVDDADKTAAIASDGQEAVDAGSIGGTLYGYPYRADNAPLLIYNSKLVSEDQTKTFEGLFAAAKAKKSTVALDIGNGWYNGFMLWAGGGDFKLDADNNIACNFANVPGCVTSATAVYDLYKNNQSAWNVTSDEGVIQSGFADGSICAAFLWNNVAAIRAAMDGSTAGVGTDIKVTGWPTLNVGGTAVASTFFKGYKHYVIKSAINTAVIPAAKAFCKFATSEAEQDKRVADADLQYGPSNLKSKAKDAAKALEWSSVIMSADAGSHTRSQALATNASFWDPMAAFGGLIKAQSNWGEFGTCQRAILNLVSSNGWKDVTTL
jgi:arabinogalactan oligomer/maltooligosaccharide transport system substrate-binding protein